MNRATVIGFLVGASALLACASMQVSEAKGDYEALLNPLLGMTKEEVVLKIGAPTTTDIFGSLEVYTYYRSYGMRGTAWVTPNQYITSAGARSWEAYDHIRCYFNSDGRFVKWDGYIQR